MRENLKRIYYHPHWILALITVVFLCSLSSCDDDDKVSDSRYPLTGTWIGTEDGGKRFSQFNEDGSGYTHRLPNGRRDDFVDYKIEDGYLWIKWVGDRKYDKKGQIEIINDNIFRTRYHSDDPWDIFERQ